MRSIDTISHSNHIILETGTNDNTRSDRFAYNPRSRADRLYDTRRPAGLDCGRLSPDRMIFGVSWFRHSLQKKTVGVHPSWAFLQT